MIRHQLANGSRAQFVLPFEKPRVADDNYFFRSRLSFLPVWRLHYRSHRRAV